MSVAAAVIALMLYWGLFLILSRRPPRFVSAGTWYWILLLVMGAASQVTLMYLAGWLHR